MADILTYRFDPTTFIKLKEMQYGTDWPIVYLIENGEEMYIGETGNVTSRFKQHYDKPERRKLSRAYIIVDQEFNKSATLDIESWLIQYIAGDGTYKLQNGNKGLSNHSYYDREKYRSKFELVWDELKAKQIVNSNLSDIKNSNLFKYSPYKSLTIEQLEVVQQIFKSVEAQIEDCHIVSGDPGTGKSVLAVYLAKLLKQSQNTRDLSIALVVPMTSLRKTLKKVFRNVSGLKPSMVLGPNEVVGKMFDLIIVDEAHRLRRRVNVTNFKSFDDSNRALNLGNTGTELDWIIRSSRSQVLFYDRNQSVRPSDIRSGQVDELRATHYKLSNQLRIEAGDEYIEFIDDLLSLNELSRYTFPNYDLRYFNNLSEMIRKVKEQDRKHGLSRLVAGYAWTWKTKNNDAKDYDIELDGLRLKWNSTNVDWVNSKNAINEIGCIHTVQGYDLNYVGVIIGPELSYDPHKKRLVIDKKKYFDINGKKSIESDEELERYILNIYKTLLTRGIKGTYIHAVDKNLQNYIESKIVRRT